MVHIFSVIYWIWVLHFVGHHVCHLLHFAWCPVPKVHQHNLGFVCVFVRELMKAREYRASLSTRFLRIFSRFFSAVIHVVVRCFDSQSIWMCFYFAYFSVSVLCAKISFSINLSAIMVFANWETEAWENVYVVLYQFLSRQIRNSHMPLPPRKSGIRLDGWESSENSRLKKEHQRLR